MKFSLDDRGVSEVLGAILVFGLLVSLLTIIQVSGVPALNEQVEFEHNARVQDDMRSFGSSVDSAAATGRDQPVDIETGVRYPPRLFLINPGPTAGTLSTTGLGEITFSNLEALDPEAGDYINSANGPAPYTTMGLVYQPNYNQYRTAPETRYEHGILYNIDDDGGVSVMDGGALVSGTRISLTTVEGSLATSGGDSVSLTAVPSSAPSQVVSVQNNSNGPLTLTLPTALDQSTWNDLLAEQRVSNGGHVSDVVVSGSKVTITFEEGVTYDLRLAKVAVSGGVDDEPPAYLTKVGPTSPTVQPGGTDLTVELRDRYNTPVAGKEIKFSVTDGSATFPKGDNGTTDADGRVTVTVNPMSNSSLTIEAWHDVNKNGVRDPSEGDAFTVVYDSLTVADNTQGGSGDLADINPRGNVIEYVSASVPGNNVNDRKIVDVTFRKNDTATWTITRARIPFVLGTGIATEVDITRETNGPVVKNDLQIGSGLTLVSNSTISDSASDSLVTFRFTFDEIVAGQGGPFDGLIVITFEATREGDNNVYEFTYFVGQ